MPLAPDSTITARLCHTNDIDGIEGVERADEIESINLESIEFLESLASVRAINGTVVPLRVAGSCFIAVLPRKCIPVKIIGE